MSSSGMSTELSGPVEVFLAGLIGAIGGFVLGMLAGAVSRVLTINRANGMIGGPVWGAYGAGAGALALAVLEALV